jgi:hypothetical protein
MPWQRTVRKKTAAGWHVLSLLSAVESEGGCMKPLHEEETNVMKRMIQLALFAAASFLAVSGVQAQTKTVAIADIPFDFTCQQKAMPHGIYMISVLQAGFIKLSTKDSKNHAISLVQPNDKVAGPGAKLVFHRYGDRYFLSQIQTATDERGMKLPMSKAEQQTRLNEARLHGNETALVALK